MLTGDKVETATCIAISAGLKSKNQSIFKLVESDNMNHIQIESELKSFRDKSYSNLLIIDGGTLKFIMANKRLEETFFESACMAPSVAICRCSPTQKAEVARCIKYYTKRRIACVGDGGNDVAMI
jgi:phospholipid-translocating ATPase